MTATGTPAALPITRCPACPTAVERGKKGMLVKGMRKASESSSANPPRPDPSTSPILGRTEVCESRNCAAAPALVKSSVISQILDIHLALPGHDGPAAVVSFALSGLGRIRFLPRAYALGFILLPLRGYAARSTEELSPAFRFGLLLRLLRRHPARYRFHVCLHQRHQFAHRPDFLQIPDSLFKLFLRAFRQYALCQRPKLLFDFSIRERVARIAF